MKNNYPKKGNKTCLFKRSLAFILSCAIAVPLLVPENTQKRVETAVHAATENITYGDVNSDGKISILDIIALKSYILEKNTDGFSVKAADLDGDGLSDYDEVKKYKTNPLKEDTDGDGISDNGEIKLGLDPLKVKSDGKTSDAERTFEQKLSSDSDMLKIVNNEDSPYQLSISAKSSGYINEAVSVDISAYSNYLQNDAAAGDIIDIDYADDFKIESMKISFSVSENAERYFIF